MHIQQIIPDTHTHTNREICYFIETYYFNTSSSFAPTTMQLSTFSSTKVEQTAAK